jgi:DNA-directed RNA polymerase specialized sigma24 family protein
MQSEPKQNPSLNSLNDDTEFENLFTKWFKRMQGYAFSILRDENAAEEIVQQVFYTIWLKQLHREVKGSIKAYLYKSVYNQCMNYLKHQKHQINHHLHVAYHQKNNVDDESFLNLNIMKPKKIWSNLAVSDNSACLCRLLTLVVFSH